MLHVERPWQQHFLLYCPLHEFERDQCDEWCAPRRDELRRLDNALRKYWTDHGYRFSVYLDGRQGWERP